MVKIRLKSYNILLLVLMTFTGLRKFILHNQSADRRKNVGQQLWYLNPYLNTKTRIILKLILDTFGAKIEHWYFLTFFALSFSSCHFPLALLYSRTKTPFVRRELWNGIDDTAFLWAINWYSKLFPPAIFMGLKWSLCIFQKR